MTGAGLMRRIFTALVAGGLAIGLATGARAETLADALASAYRNSNLLEQNRALLRAADEGVAQAVATLRPVVDYAVTASAVRTKLNSFLLPGNELSTSYPQSFSLSATMLLADFGRSKTGIALARENVMATRQSLTAVEQDVLLAAVAAYVDVRLQSETLSLRQSNVRLITQELRAAKDRFDVGEATRTDVAQAEAALAAAQAGEEAAQGALTLAREHYLATVGHYPEGLSPVPAAPALPASVEAAREVAMQRHPVLLQVQHQVKIADLQVDFARADFRPTLSARAALTENWSSLEEGGFFNPDSESLSLNFNQTLYAGGRKASLLRQAIAGQEAARAGLHQTAVLVGENVGRAWSNLSVASASIQAGEKQVRAAQAAFDGIKEEADLGARTTLDVLEAEQDLLDARFARLTSEANLTLGTYQLLSTMGLLTVDHLNLRVPTYDVGAYYKAVEKAPAHSPQGAKLDRILKSVGGN